MGTRYGFTLRTDKPWLYVEVETAGMSDRGEQRWRVTVRKQATPESSSSIKYRSLASSRSSAFTLASDYCNSIGVRILTPIDE